MLRQKLRKLFVNKENFPLVHKLFILMTVLGWLWLLTFPYISRNVFTSENALNGSYIQTTFGSDNSGFSIYKTV